MLLNLLLLLAVAGLFYWFIVRPWFVRLGATDEEVTMPLPGDELVSQVKQGSTRAITINAHPAAVWPWIVQLGQEKGGLYSYETLENLIGCNIHNAERIVPEWQNTRAGDTVRLGPKGYPLYRVQTIVPNQYMLMRAADPKTEKVTEKIPETGMYANGTWLFYLKPNADGTTRLIIRSLLEFDSGWASWLMWRTVECLHAIMEAEMLRGIKSRAENQKMMAAR